MQTFHCRHTYPSGHVANWKGSWEALATGAGSHELRIKGRGSSFHAVLGHCTSGNYLCIPLINAGCALASWRDTFWNTEQLSCVIGETDAVTIAAAINDYGNYCAGGMADMADMTGMADLEIEYSITKEALREADECFRKLREDYHSLREHADLLETLLRSHGIAYPDFCGW